MNGYELSRNWFDWCFENPEKISPTHTAMYFFIIEHCNRLGWKEKFGLPTTMVKDAIGIRNFRTYVNTLNDLVEWGFIIMVEKSKNQYSSNIIAIAKFTKAPAKAHTKALDKALQKHHTKQRKSIDSIDKQLNKEQENKITILHPLQTYINDNFEFITKMKKQMTYENCESLVSQFDKNKIVDILQSMENWNGISKKASVYLTALKWLKNDFSKKGQNLSNGTSKMEGMVGNYHEAMEILKNNNTE